MRTFLFLIPLFFSVELALCQKNINIKDNHGKITITDKYITPKDKIFGILAPIPSLEDEIYKIDLGAKFTFPKTFMSSGLYSNSILPIICTNPKTPLNFNDVDSPFNFSLKLVNDKILVSATIIDLKTGEVITKIVDNKWMIKSSKKLSYVSTKSYLEIVDNYGFVCFRLEVGKDKLITVRGYFVGNYCSVFLRDGNMMTVTRDSDYEVEKVKYASSNKVKYCTTND